MLENGTPPCKFNVLYRLLHIEFHDYNSRFDILRFSHFIPGVSSIFTDGMGHVESICPVDICYALEMYKP